MAKIKVRYLVIKPGRAGTKRYFWQPSKALAAAGWKQVRLDDAECTTIDQIIAKAEKLNAQLDAWRKGEAAEGTKEPPPPAPAGLPNTIANLIRSYKSHRRYTRLAKSTRERTYDWGLRIIEEWAGDTPVKAITRAMVQEFYESLLETSHSKANAVLRVLRVLLKYAVDQNKADINAAEKPGMIGLEARLRIWTDEEIDVLVETADEAGWPSVGDAVLYAVYFGQRQGDILTAKEIQYQPSSTGENRLLIRQRKTKALIDVPAHPRIEARIASQRARRKKLGVTAPTLVWHEGTKKPWGEDNFRHVFNEIRAQAAKKCPSLLGLLPEGEEPDPDNPPLRALFLDLRDTAVTKLAEAGCTVPEIASITGHAPDSAYKILRHYLALNGQMASAGIAKLVAYEEQKRKQKGSNH